MIASGLCFITSTVPFEGAVDSGVVIARPLTWKVMYSLSQRAFYLQRGSVSPWDQHILTAGSFDAAALVLEGLHYDQLRQIP